MPGRGGGLFILILSILLFFIGFSVLFFNMSVYDSVEWPAGMYEWPSETLFDYIVYIYMLHCNFMQSIGQSLRPHTDNKEPLFCILCSLWSVHRHAVHLIKTWLKDTYIIDETLTDGDNGDKHSVHSENDIVQLDRVDSPRVLGPVFFLWTEENLFNVMQHNTIL